MVSRVLFSSQSGDWETPKDLYRELDKEFKFNDDPCPRGGKGGLDRMWGTSTYVNPPYGRDVDRWIKKAVHEFHTGSTVVMLLPARTDTRWFHEYILEYAADIRFIKGRLHFSGHKNAAPFPSMVAVFKECQKD